MSNNMNDNDGRIEKSSEAEYDWQKQLGETGHQAITSPQAMTSPQESDDKSSKPINHEQQFPPNADKNGPGGDSTSKHK